MITGKNIYDVFAAIVQLYVAMILAYGSVRWWKIFTPEQCSGINRFVSVFAIPFLSFKFIASNNPYTMNYMFIAADSLQKVAILVLLFLFVAISKRGSLDWTITLFSLSTLPNTLVMGVPLLEAMYGKFTQSLMIQIVVLQSVIWYTLLLFMFEYRGAKILMAEQFPETAAAISSFKVDPDVVSLGEHKSLQADAEIAEDGKLHVVLKRSNSGFSISSSFDKSHNLTNSLFSIYPRASDLSSVEIFSAQSSTREHNPSGSGFNYTDFQATMAYNTKVITNPKNGNSHGFQGGSSNIGELVNSMITSTPSTRNFQEEMSRSGKRPSAIVPYPPPDPVGCTRKEDDGNGGVPSYNHNNNKELHMFIWSANSSFSGRQYSRQQAHSRAASNDLEEENDYPSLPINHAIEASSEIGIQATKKGKMPPSGVVIRLILVMVWRKLIRNPNTYASILGLVWSLIAFRFHFEMPSIVANAISILSNTGLGMAMFSLGLFMASQPKIIACGKSLALLAMAVRFLIGPAVMAITSVALGLRGNLLRVAIIQAALPQGIVPFVFAKEYSLHPTMLSTAVIFGMVVALPVTILYFVIFQLIR